jgi:hypothetical protein
MKIAQITGRSERAAEHINQLEIQNIEPRTLEARPPVVTVKRSLDIFGTGTGTVQFLRLSTLNSTTRS